MDNKFTVGREYPEIVDAHPNEYYVRLLYNLRSSCESELTAILQYLFQHNVLENCNKELAHIIEEISIVEMHHMELLGEAIVAFGGKPCYINSQGENFNSCCVAYFTDVRQILEKNIMDEENAIKAYRQTASCVQNESLRDLLLTIAEDECVHAKIFKELLEDLDVYRRY